MARDVTLEHVSIRFGSHLAVDNAFLTIKAGEFFSFLGPSGCGKTTLLRAISGFIDPSEGRVLIGGEDMRRIGPNKRPTALIFQNLALFALMSVAENIAFPLEVRGVSRKERRKRADELLELIALPGIGDKKVHELSGGQRQRVAIARALAVQPDILLLDEPLSALDLKLRQHMRTELRAIQRQVGLTFIYITHDQGEALTMSDRVGVMNSGVIEQVDDPETVYERPKTTFVASFVGENNALPGKVIAQEGEMVTMQGPGGSTLHGRAAGGRHFHAGEPVTMFVRPEQMRPTDAAAGDNTIPALLNKEEFEGPVRHLFLSVEGAEIRVTRGTDGTASPSSGTILNLSFDPARASVMPAAAY